MARGKLHVVRMIRNAVCVDHTMRCVRNNLVLGSQIVAAVASASTTASTTAAVVRRHASWREAPPWRHGWSWHGWLSRANQHHGSAHHKDHEHVKSTHRVKGVELRVLGFAYAETR